MVCLIIQKVMYVSRVWLCPRVCYVPGHTDPASTRGSSPASHPRLTPNAVNVHGRVLQLQPGLFLTGFSEPATEPSEIRDPSTLPVSTAGYDTLLDDLKSSKSNSDSAFT